MFIVEIGLFSLHLEFPLGILLAGFQNFLYQGHLLEEATLFRCFKPSALS